jgi:hypothetical protein
VGLSEGGTFWQWDFLKVGLSGSGTF